MAQPEHEVCIVGGGIMGVSTAYFLTLRGVKVVLVERSSIAAAASGKAGGFLAREWGDEETTPLHNLGFDTIVELSKTLGLESFRFVPTLSVGGRAKKAKNVVDWLNNDTASSTPMDGTTAQVTPKELVDKMMAAAISRGARVVIGNACGVQVEHNNSSGAATITAVKLADGTTIPCAQVLFALGPWTCLLEDWLPKHPTTNHPLISVPIVGVTSSSFLLPSNASIDASPHALFCDHDELGCHLEVYPRPNGQVYVCGCGGSDKVKPERLKQGGDREIAESVHAAPQRVVAALQSLRGKVLGYDDVEPIEALACMRPFLPDGKPMIGKIDHTTNAFVCAGHNCWGILWGPASGLVMSQLMSGEVSSIPNLSHFAPGRYV